MEKRKLIWTDKAVSDLKEIHAYVSLDSPQKASAVVEKIVQKTRQLKDFPESGRRIPELQKLEQYREMLLKPYRIQYRIDEHAVYILQIFHSSRFFDGLI